MVAKISNLGTAHVVDLQPGQLVRSLTHAPGTLVYMYQEVHIKSIVLLNFRQLSYQNYHSMYIICAVMEYKIWRTIHLIIYPSGIPRYPPPSEQGRQLVK